MHSATTEACAHFENPLKHTPLKRREIRPKMRIIDRRDSRVEGGVPDLASDSDVVDSMFWKAAGRARVQRCKSHNSGRHLISALR